MQFDFLNNLFARAPGPAAPAPAPPSLSPPPVSPTSSSVPLPPSRGPALPTLPPAPDATAQPPIAIPRGKKIPLPPVAALLATSRALLTAAGARALAARVQIRWNPRLRSTAGMAYAAKSLVTLNPGLLLFGDAELDRTLRHELAHLLAHYRAGRRRIDPHGKEWRRACRDLGLPDEKRTHDLPLPRRTVHPKHLYRCPNCDLELKRVRPLRRNAACLFCCKKFHNGKYHIRFRFEQIDASQAR